MLTYEDREIFKTQIKDKEREYFRKKSELEQLKEEIIWNIGEYEKMFGQTDNFNRMKQEQFQPTRPQYAPGYQPNYNQQYGYRNVYDQPRRKRKKSIDIRDVFGIIAVIVTIIYILL